VAAHPQTIQPIGFSIKDKNSESTRLTPGRVIQIVEGVTGCKLFPGIGLGCLLWAANAQGGPPLLTDDPDTPGPNHWEINVAVTLENMARGWEAATPLLDMNYGVGERIQLKYQVQFNDLAPPSGAVRAGMGNSLAGVKWRFIDQTNASWLEVSTYPQLEFVYPASSPPRGLAVSGDNVLLPFEVEHKFQSLTVYAEAGFLWNEHPPTAGIYGLAGEYEFSEKFSLMGEFYAGFDRAFQNTGLSFNLGFRRFLTEHVSLIGSAGRGIFGPSENAPAFMGYLALQLTL
jgi:hypothetical protein